MKILITGAGGFIGKNLCAALSAIRSGLDSENSDLNIDEVFSYTRSSSLTTLDVYCSKADFVFHFAGVNRAENEDAFLQANVVLTKQLLELLRRHNNACPVLFSSSIQASLQGSYDNPYGRSKKQCEELLLSYATETGAPVYIYRFPNVFGKWCRPNYNSVVATFCYHIARDLPITIQNPNCELSLLYIDDLICEMLLALRGKVDAVENFCSPQPTYQITVRQIADMLWAFHADACVLAIPQMPEGSLRKKMYSTYLSYLPSEKISLPLQMNVDERGSFTELLKLSGAGQVSVNITKPGITKGEHWHHSKWEVFVVVSGEGLIRQRMLGAQHIIEHFVSSKKMEAVRILPGYVHNIVNLSQSEDLITVMWANEAFDRDRPDTFYEKVSR